GVDQCIGRADLVGPAHLVENRFTGRHRNPILEVAFTVAPCRTNVKPHNRIEFRRPAAVTSGTAPRRRPLASFPTPVFRPGAPMSMLSQACQALLLSAGVITAGAAHAQESAEVSPESDPSFQQLEEKIPAILDSDAKIPVVEKIGDHYYTFWKDAQHERGLWRRTTLDEHRRPQPAW